MNLIIQGKNVEINESLRVWVEKKLGSIKRFHEDLDKQDDLPDGEEERVDMEVELEKMSKGQRKGRIFRAEAQFMLGGKMFRAESIKHDMREAIVDVKNQLERSLRRFKGKEEARKRKGARKAKKRRR